MLNKGCNYLAIKGNIEQNLTLLIVLNYAISFF